MWILGKVDVLFYRKFARSQAPAWERDCNKSSALSQIKQSSKKAKQELLIQAHSQAGAWERGKWHVCKKI